MQQHRSSAGGRKSVLVVEDETFVRVMAVDALEGAGYDVREASDADEALSVLEGASDDISVVFTDIKMPGSMDGLGLAEIVGDRWPDIRVIVTSGHMMLPDPAVGYAAFLPKPYRLNALTDKIEALSS